MSLWAVPACGCHPKDARSSRLHSLPWVSTKERASTSLILEAFCGPNTDTPCPGRKLTLHHVSPFLGCYGKEGNQPEKEWFSGLESLRPVILNVNPEENSVSDISVHLSDVYQRLGNLSQQQKYICCD